jgi:hypothetical protein
MKTTRILLAAGTLVLGACAGTMNKDECRTVDWRTVGYEIVSASIARPVPRQA